MVKVKLSDELESVIKDLKDLGIDSEDVFKIYDPWKDDYVVLKPGETVDVSEDLAEILIDAGVAKKTL